jgi:hypothetical protein
METRSIEQQPKFVRWALMLGIIVILNIFFTVLLSVAYPAPDYNTYCPAQPAITPTDAATCDASGGVWTENPTVQPAPSPQYGAVTPAGYCDMYAKCQPLYQAASDTHNLYAFIILVVLGVLSLLAGLIPIGSSIVSSGLSYGGVVALIVASSEYWSDANSWLRLAITAVGLIALIYIGYRRFRD